MNSFFGASVGLVGGSFGASVALGVAGAWVGLGVAGAWVGLGVAGAWVGFGCGSFFSGVVTLAVRHPVLSAGPNFSRHGSSSHTELRADTDAVSDGQLLLHSRLLSFSGMAELTESS